MKFIHIDKVTKKETPISFGSAEFQMGAFLGGRAGFSAAIQEAKKYGKRVFIGRHADYRLEKES